MKKKTFVLLAFICAAFSAGTVFGSVSACFSKLDFLRNFFLPQNKATGELFVKNAIPFLLIFLCGFLPFGIPVIVLLMFALGTGYSCAYCAKLVQSGTGKFLPEAAQFSFSIFIVLACIITALYSSQSILLRFEKAKAAKVKLKREKEKIYMENIIIFISAVILSLLSAVIENGVYRFCLVGV